jgi:hypothetical protein
MKRKNDEQLETDVKSFLLALNTSTAFETMSKEMQREVIIQLGAGPRPWS